MRLIFTTRVVKKKKYKQYYCSSNTNTEVFVRYDGFYFFLTRNVFICATNCLHKTFHTEHYGKKSFIHSTLICT